MEFEYLIKFGSDNKALGCPFLLANIKEVYPEHDWTKGHPAGYGNFKRAEPKELGIYEKFDPAYNDGKMVGQEYVLTDSSYFTSVWHYIDLTDEEKKAKQDEMKASFAESPNYASWVFNETTCDYDPPIPKPVDGRAYDWDESTLSWKVHE